MADRELIKEIDYKSVYRDGDTIVKEFIPSHSKAKVFNEAYIQSCVEEAGVPVPKVYGVGPTKEGGWALTMEYIEGKTLQELMDEDPSKEEQYLEKLVDIQLEVGSYRVPQIRNTRYKMEEIVKELDSIDAGTRYELLQRLHGMRRHTKLCHGDFVPSNVILREDGSYTVLDWSHATSGNAGADAAITYMRFAMKDEKRARAYLRIFSRKADMTIPYIQDWLPIVAAVHMGKYEKEEREILEKWVSVAQYQ